MQEPFMRPDAVAQLLGISKPRVYGLIKEHKIPGGIIAGAVRIPVQAWQQWLDEQSMQALANLAQKDGAHDASRD